MSKKSFLLGSAAALAMAGVCFAAPDTGGGAAEDKEAKIRRAISQLDPDNADDWTDSGLPNMARVKELTGLEDLKRSEIGEAQPGFNRTNAGSPQSGGPGSKSTATADAAPSGEPKNESGEGMTELEKAEQNIKPNSDPATNPNAGNPDLGPYEGQAHTADQRELLHAQMSVEDQKSARRDRFMREVEAGNVDAIELLEMAVAAAATDRYRRNGALQNLVRAYQVDQVNIKDMQGRLDSRNERRADQAKEADARLAKGE